MGSKGDCYDNSVAESFFAALKKELIHRETWPTKRGLISAVFEYVEAFYNPTRRHFDARDALPMQFEEKHLPLLITTND
jgi:putative transposase